MKEKRRKNKPTTWRCTHSGCREELSLLARCSYLFIYSDEKRGKPVLPLTQVLEIIWIFLHTQSTIRLAPHATQHRIGTIVSWWHTCRRVCSLTADEQPRFVSLPGSPLQVDELFFSGRRKYRRGRLETGDLIANRVDIKNNGESDDELEGWTEKKIKRDEYDGPMYKEDVQEWLWVVGFYQSAE